LPPTGYPSHAPSLYGYVTQQAVARAEIQAHASLDFCSSNSRKRCICMTVTGAPPDHLRVSAVSSEAQGEAILEQINAFIGRGRPSSWSTAIDQLSSGALDEQHRLVLLPVGNTQPWSRRYYPNSNLTESIHDPGQAWNALTVGAYTMKTTVNPKTYPGWKPVAPAGGLSPAGTTSLRWEEQWPLKPDLCMEGGNMAIDPSTGNPDYLDDLQLLTTNRALLQRLLTVTGDTSAATALAARMAAIIQAEYPQFWPETVRALMVHSADWTPAMRRQTEPLASRQTIRNVLRSYGYGVPNLERALWSARHELTLVVQDSLQPFDRQQNGRTVTRDMHLHPLPWPHDVLRELGDMIVELRVTLSYFIEPNPGERGRERRHRYASHGLRFDVNTPTEIEFITV